MAMASVIGPADSGSRSLNAWLRSSDVANRVAGGSTGKGFSGVITSAAVRRCSTGALLAVSTWLLISS